MDWEKKRVQMRIKMKPSRIEKWEGRQWDWDRVDQSWGDCHSANWRHTCMPVSTLEIQLRNKYNYKSKRKYTNQPKHSGHLCHIESSLKYPSFPSWNDISYLSLCAMSSFQISRQKRSITGQYVCHLNGLHAENCMHLQRKRRQTTRVTQSDKTINRSLQVFLIRRQHIKWFLHSWY